MTINGVDYEKSGVSYQYYPTPTLVSISPAFASLAGGSKHTIRGKNFRHSDSALCIFGIRNSINSSTSWSDSVYAQYIDESTIECVSPASVMPGVVDVFYSQNGVHLEASLGVSSFEYVADPAIFRVEPQLGSVLVAPKSISTA